MDGDALLATDLMQSFHCKQRQMKVVAFENFKNAMPLPYLSSPSRKIRGLVQADTDYVSR